MVTGFIDPSISVFGIHVATAFSFILLLGVAKILFDVLLRLFVAIRTHGCNWYILLALYDLALMALLLPIRTLARATSEAQDQLAAYFEHLKQDQLQRAGAPTAEEQRLLTHPSRRDLSEKVTLAVAQALQARTPAGPGVESVCASSSSFLSISPSHSLFLSPLTLSLTRRSPFRGHLRASCTLYGNFIFPSN